MRACTVRLPGCRNEVETTVLAHCPSIDDGRGFKSPDHWGAFACRRCHDVLDGRILNHGIDESEILSRWLAGIYETQKAMIEAGLIVIV